MGYEKKLGWIVSLEDRRILRDPAPPQPPPTPPVPERRGANVTATPLPTPDLLSLSSDSDARLRRRAALAIGRVRLVEGVAPLAKALTDADPEVRQMAAFGLGLIGSRSATPQLLGALARDSSPLVRGRAAEALALIGEASAADAIGEMAASYLQAGAVSAVAPDESRWPLAPEAEAFRLGIYALARLKAFEPLARAVLADGGQPRVQWWPVAYALQRTEDPRAETALVTFLRGPSVYGAAFAARGLGFTKSARAADTLVPLLNKRDLSPAILIQAIRALGRLGHEQGVQPLLTLLDRRDIDDNARLEAVNALGQLRARPAYGRLLDFAVHRWPPLRAASLRAVAAIDRNAFVGVLSSLDDDANWSVRASLAETLGTLDASVAEPRLRGAVNDSDQRVVSAALRALVRIKASDTEEILSNKLKGDDVVVRATAATLLGESKATGAASALAAAYDAASRDTTYIARAAIIEAFGKLGTEGVRPWLERGLGDPDWAVRVKAALLIEPPAQAQPPAWNVFSPELGQRMRPAPAQYGREVIASLVAPRFSPHAYIHTSKGVIEIELAVLDAPLTSHNFMTLARKGFFNGTRIHRVVPDFVLQDGDPRGDGEGGPGYSIRDELSDLPYLRGTVGMALDWADTGGSQFFITHSPQPHLDARYTAFARVVKGMEVVDLLQQWDTIDRVVVWDGVTLTQRSAVSGRRSAVSAER
jgi:cyclophilin family peptidyl-prolyl cis-trans isomerase/HEAT repeat protein